MAWRDLRNHLSAKNLFSSKRKTSQNNPRPRLDKAAAPRAAEHPRERIWASYFNNGGTPSGRGQETPLREMFASLRGPRDEPDSLGIESSMAYIQSLGASIEDASMFVVLDVIQAPSIGQITQEGYVRGWSECKAVADSQSHAKYIRHCIDALSSDRSFFRRIYRSAFTIGKEPDQKALSLENALIYWSILFTPPGWEWQTPQHNWLELWTEFLNANWKHSVNRDMWNQLLEFAFRSVDDPTLLFWNEDGAWPSVIDDFVIWFREKTTQS